MRSITKSVFLKAMACPKLGWLEQNRREAGDGDLPDLSLDVKFRIEQGIEIHKRARSLYPRGHVVGMQGMRKAVAATKSAIQNPDVTTIYEGAFLSGGFAARADILRRHRGGWHLLEVKSSTNDREEFTDDMAYTVMVLRKAGLDVRKVSIVLVSKDYRLGMGVRKLFALTERTEEVLERAGEFLAEAPEIRRVLLLKRSPPKRIAFDCKGCEIYGECLGKGARNHILELPRLSRSKFERLAELGVSSIDDIPRDFPLTGHQMMVRNAVCRSRPWLGAGLGERLSKIKFPASYLDFETFMTAVPLYPETAPFTRIPTQYSIHWCTHPGEVVGHAEYLADPGCDCRRELAEHLIADLPGRGSIIVYSGFEQSVIRDLSGLYPDLADNLGSIVKRLVDLEAVVRKNFYHPDFHGRTSIKVTLPTLVPSMGYDDLEISGGGSAMAVFAYMAMGRYDDEQAAELKHHLLEYCKRDTLAMVYLHERLVDFA